MKKKRKPLTNGRRRLSTQNRRRRSALLRAFIDGRHDAVHMNSTNPYERHMHMNDGWNAWVQRTGYRANSWREYFDIAKLYTRGYTKRAGIPSDDAIVWSTTRRVACILTVMNEESTLPSVLAQTARLPFAQTIIVVNGSTDRTLQVARRDKQAKVVYYPEPLGHDVGRAIGTKLADADIFLYLDGDIKISAEALVPFVQSIDRGLDVALNDITPFVGRFDQLDSVSVLKQFLNCSHGREDLRMNSMTAVPFALSLKAIEVIGSSRLAVPPLAHAIAVKQGLRIGTGGSVDVVKRNRLRKHNIGLSNPVSRMIIGDHWEALHDSMNRDGSRLHFPDNIRLRSRLGEGNKG